MMRADGGGEIDWIGSARYEGRKGWMDGWIGTNGLYKIRCVDEGCGEKRNVCLNYGIALSCDRTACWSVMTL